MKKLIFLFIPLLTFGQNFNTKFKTDSLEYRIDSTNTLGLPAGVVMIKQ